MTSPTTDFGAVGGSYASYNTSGRGRLRHDLVARRLLAELPEPRQTSWTSAAAMAR